jgi:hypothetical protein
MNINNYPDNRNPLTMPLVPTTYKGTHFSHGGIGGYVEVPTLDDLYAITSDDGPSAPINPDGVTSGRRKIGMIVYVIKDKKYYQLRPKFKDTKKEISWEVLNTIGDGFRGLLINPLIPYGYCEDSTLNWSSLSGQFINNNIPIENFNSLKKYGFYADLLDESSLQDGYVVGTGNLTDGVSCFGNLPEKEDPWVEIFVKEGFNTLSDLNVFASGNAAAYPGQICSAIDTNKVYLLASGISGLTPQEITSNNGSSSELFTGNFTVSIKDGKTFGQYQNGDLIEASGKSAVDVIKMACFEALDPTVTLTSSSTIPFGSTGVNISLNFSKIINTQGASVAVNKIERKRAADPDTSWNTLTSDLNAVSPLSDSFTQTQYDTSFVNYRYTVTDTANATKTVSLNITPAAYAAPTISSVNAGSATRYKGDTATTYAGTITRNSPLIAITSYKLQKSIDSGVTWSDVGSSVSVTGNPATISVSLSETNAGDTNLKNADTVQYRISVTDTYQTTNLTASTITFVHKRGIIYKAAGSFALATQALTLNDIDTAPNLSLSDTRGSTINGVTAALGVYVYYVYKSTLGNLTNVTQLPSSEVFGSFSKISNISGTNSNGATVSYIVYVTNSDGAFTNKNLQFI